MPCPCRHGAAGRHLQGCKALRPTAASALQPCPALPRVKPPSRGSMALHSSQAEQQCPARCLSCLRGLLYGLHIPIVLTCSQPPRGVFLGQRHAPSRERGKWDSEQTT